MLYLQDVADNKSAPLGGGHNNPPWEKALDSILHAAHNTMTVRVCECVCVHAHACVCVPKKYAACCL
jgi:hypothetical protein